MCRARRPRDKNVWQELFQPSPLPPPTCVTESYPPAETGAGIVNIITHYHHSFTMFLYGGPLVHPQLLPVIYSKTPLKTFQ